MHIPVDEGSAPQKSDMSTAFLRNSLLDFDNMQTIQEINERFLSLFPGLGQKELMNLFSASQSTVSDWQTWRRRIPWDKLEWAVEKKEVTWDWLLTGNSERGTPSPPVSARGEEGSGLRHLSGMAVELVDIVNNFHRRALEGVITEEQFEKILLGATGGMIGAAEECGVEPKKAIG